MVQAVTITGTRSVDSRTAAEFGGLLDTYLRPFLTPETRCYVGGAIGVDTLALEWLAQHTSTRISVVVPGTVPDQPTAARETINRWNDRGRIAEVVELAAPRLESSAYHSRNRWMVDHSEFVIGFPHGDDPASGTRYTLGYANQQGKPHLVVPL
ncbi:YpsA SLOG family protein [Amycolatopsis anabasis]|uniref:YpsA SLOG family protein n=1 Tax=Amycolatopsis anabasis TaxID=1840409 RepID=UPI001C54FFE1|nr:putative molybdenum carrier protein [Amycolatopsis anabasis]